ncbi:ABC transporter substrate-binding protein [Sulfurovum sp. CS9]|uniref:ABC transporter substrate-binding protein n=1 Tax=Sulfurovum sp. CS9 TaxID=3391146 RepID=UPI0039E8C717
MLKTIFIILSLFFTLAQAKELDKVSLQLKWKYQFQFAGFIVAKEKGFYKDVGLDVNIQEHNSSIDTFKDMQEGKIQFGVSDSALILESIKGTPIVGHPTCISNISICIDE